MTTVTRFTRDIYNGKDIYHTVSHHGNYMVHLW